MPFSSISSFTSFKRQNNKQQQPKQGQKHLPAREPRSATDHFEISAAGDRKSNRYTLKPLDEEEDDDEKQRQVYQNHHHHHLIGHAHLESSSKLIGYARPDKRSKLFTDSNNNNINNNNHNNKNRASNRHSLAQSTDRSSSSESFYHAYDHTHDTESHLNSCQHQQQHHHHLIIPSDRTKTKRITRATSSRLANRKETLAGQVQAKQRPKPDQFEIELTSVRSPANMKVRPTYRSLARCERGRER